jgi:hypothetical protein
MIAIAGILDAYRNEPKSFGETLLHLGALLSGYGRSVPHTAPDAP